MQEDLRPYFSLPKVMDGLFNLANMLFGIVVEPADGLALVICFTFFLHAVAVLNYRCPYSDLLMVHFLGLEQGCEILQCERFCRQSNCILLL